MKKLIVCLLLIAMFASLLTGCCLSHEWEPATCDAPSTCAKCGETEGEKLEHIQGEWVVTSEATYIEKGEQTAYCTLCECELATQAYGKPVIENGLFVISKQAADERIEVLLEEYYGDITTTSSQTLVLASTDSSYMGLKFLQGTEGISGKLEDPMNADTCLLVFVEGSKQKAHIAATVEFCFPDIDEATLDSAVETLMNGENYKYEEITFRPGTYKEGSNTYECIYISAKAL